MNYAKIDYQNMLNGTGVRTVLWLSGCEHACEGCHNPQTWDRNSGKLFDEVAKQNIFKSLEDEYISGLTITGGDPLAEYNREEVMELCIEVKEKYPDKDIWIWTGYEIGDIYKKAWWLSDLVDVIIDGKYEKDNPTQKKWRGSDNQEMIEFIDGIMKFEHEEDY